MQTFTIPDANIPAAALHGLCPRCRDGFDCTGWETLPAPACPRCGTRAQQVVRGGPDRCTALATELWMG